MLRTVSLETNTKNGKYSNLIARTTLNSAILGGIVQGSNCLVHARSIKKAGAIKPAFKSIGATMVNSAILGAVVSGVYCLYNVIKNKIQNKNNQNL